VTDQKSRICKVITFKTSSSCDSIYSSFSQSNKANTMDTISE